MEELARKEATFLSRVLERDPRDRGEVRRGRDGNHQQDEEGEADELPGAGAQGHEVASERGRARVGITTRGCSG
jgi:hypothetical protein